MAICKSRQGRVSCDRGAPLRGMQRPNSAKHLRPVRPEKHLDPQLDGIFDLARAQAFDHAEQEPLVDVTQAEIDEVPGGAFRIGQLERARGLERAKFGRQAGRAEERTGFVECAADIRETSPPLR